MLQTKGTEVQEKVFEFKDGGHWLSLRSQFKENGRGRNLVEKILADTDHST